MNQYKIHVYFLFLFLRPRSEHEFENVVEKFERQGFPIGQGRADVVGIGKDALRISEDFQDAPKHDGEERSDDEGKKYSQIDEDVDVREGHRKYG